jgi:hypothetical protein
MFNLSVAYLCSDHECDTIFEGPGDCPKCLNSNVLALARVLNRSAREQSSPGASRAGPALGEPSAEGDMQQPNEYPKEDKQ